MKATVVIVTKDRRVELRDALRSATGQRFESPSRSMHRMEFYFRRNEILLATTYFARRTTSAPPSVTPCAASTTALGSATPARR
jgi:hypothetical protein